MKTASFINCFLAIAAAMLVGCVSVPPPPPIDLSHYSAVHRGYGLAGSPAAPSSYVDPALGAYLGTGSRYRVSRSGYAGRADESYRVRSDFLDGYRISDSQGNTTRVRPDFMGGYRATDQQGNTTRIRPDFLGGWRATHQDGTVTRARSDQLGGYRITGDDGTSLRLRSDFMGGYRGYDNEGNYYRIKPSGY
jgi:hypothetical protein